MTGKRKICLVIPSLQAGGMERVMSELLWYFSSKKDLELQLVLYGKTREIFFEIPGGIEVHKPGFLFNDRWRVFHTIRTLLFLRRIIKKIDPATVLSYGEYWNNFVLLSLLGLKYPVFVSDRSQPDKSLGRFHDRLRRWLYPSATGVILQSAKAREVFLRRNRHEHIAVFGNPIRSILNDGPATERGKSVLMVGRLIESKHQDRLIRIFAGIDMPEWKLLIVGYDHLKQQHADRLENLIRELHQEGRVILMGKQSQVEDIYLSSSIFAFTSSSEGFPNAIGEAMSAGLPVVAYDCMAGPSEMIEDGRNGYLIPLFDDELFRERLGVLMRDEELRERMGQKAREDIKRFSIWEIGERYLDFILDRKQMNKNQSIET